MSGMLERVAVIGAGAFGTALAIAAARAGRTVTLLARRAADASDLELHRENRRHLPGIPLPDRVRCSADPADLSGAELLLFAVPAQATRAVCLALADSVPPGIAALACAKGLEAGTAAHQTAIVGASLPQCRPAALSGPGFAEEIARGLPTALAVAADDIALAHRICAGLSSSSVRLYATKDVPGVELGGAAKNVLAIACGVVAGRGLGESARAALIARGLAEMTRLGTALGAQPQTFMGLSGLGDLVLTATSERSRNTAFGIALGRGRPIGDLLAEGTPLVEGAYTAAVMADLAESHAIEVPIMAAVAAMIAGRLTVDEAVESLVTRPLKAEFD